MEVCCIENLDLVREIEKSLYVDDFISGGFIVKVVFEVKVGVIYVFN